MDIIERVKSFLFTGDKGVNARNKDPEIIVKRGGREVIVKYPARHRSLTA